MKIAAILPARMASSRFPGKPIENILGLPMIEHVRQRCALSSTLDQVVVATCDQEIMDVVREHGGLAVMTADTYERCTDRIAEAALSLETDIVINVQGDEPLVRPEMLESLIPPFEEDADLLCVNLVSEITNDAEFNDPSVVKAVCDLHNNILYFSREAIPSAQKAQDSNYKKYRQLGVIAFRKDFLLKFAQLPPTPLEAIESVDMLRALEHGYKIRMVTTPFLGIGVDTPQDLENAAILLKKDELLPYYLGK